MNILVTGASGFIGRRLCRRLGESHYICGTGRSKRQVVGCTDFVTADLAADREAGPGRGDPDAGAPDASHGGDRTIAEKIPRDIDTVVHLAARLAGPGEEADLAVLEDNVRMARAVVRLTRQLGARHLLHFSTMAVYPNQSGEYDEESRIWPAANTECLYGLSKFASENVLSRFAGEGVTVTHLRVAQVRGEGMREDRVIPMMLRELEEHNRITVFGNGERVSNFIRVERLTEIALRMLEHPVPGVFNVGGEHVSYHELAKGLIAAHGDANSTLRLREEGSRARFRLNTDKLERHLPGLPSL